MPAATPRPRPSGFRRRGGNEDRLSGINPILVPARDVAGLSIDLDDRVEKVAGGPDARSPDIAIGLAGVSFIVDAGQFQRYGRKGLTCDFGIGTERHAKARERASRIDRRAGAEPRQIKLLDDPGIGIGDHVDDDTVPVLEGVDVMEGEGGLAARGRHDLSALLVDRVEPQPALRLPAIILDEGGCQ